MLDAQLAHLQVVLGVEAARDGREVLESVVSDHPGVFDADAPEPELVEPGLHRDDIAFTQRVFRRLPERGLFMSIKPNAVAGAVVHLGHAIGALVAFRRGAKSTVDEDLAYREVNILRRHTRADRLLAGFERLHGGCVHAPKLVGHLAHDHRPGEIAVIVTGPPDWEDVDDHRGAGANRSLAPEMRQGIFR